MRNDKLIAFLASVGLVGIVAGVLFGIFSIASAQTNTNFWKLAGTVLSPVQNNWTLTIPSLGGSGTRCLQVSNTGAISVAAGACGSGSGGGGLASTTPWTAGQVAMVVDNATVQGVSTTTLTASSPLSLSNPVAKIGGVNSVLTIDTSGTWTGNAGTASALAANGSNCNSGFFPLGVSAAGASENCTYAVATTSPWAANQFVYTNASGVLVSAASSSLSLPNTALQNSTISGIALGSNLADLTATNGTLTFSGTYNGGTARTIGLNLGNANTWTAHQIFSSLNATAASTSNATTTNLHITGLNCSGNANGGALTTDANGRVSCSDDDGGAGGGVSSVGTTYPVTGGPITTSGTIALAFGTTTNNVWAGLQTFTNSSTTLASFGYASSTLWYGGGLQACGTNQWLAWASGAWSCASLSTTGDWTGTFDGQEGSYYLNRANHTGTLAISQGGTGTTTAPAGQLLYGGATAYQSVATSSATCTGASGITCTNFNIVGAGGTTLALSAIPNSSLANSTISGISLGGTLANLSATDSTLTFSGTYTGATARTIGINLANPNTWTALQMFSNSTTTLADIFSLRVGRTATTTIGTDGAVTIPSGSNLTITGKSDGCATFASGVLNSTGSACGSGGGGGTDVNWTFASNKLGLYPSTTTNDVWLGATATATAPFWFDVSATTTYIGNGGAYDSIVTLGPTSDAWTLGYKNSDKTFQIASSTSLGSNVAFSISKALRVIVSTFLNIPNGSDPTVSSAGDTAINTTAASSSIRYYDGTAERALNSIVSKPLVYASSTLAYVGSYGTAGTSTVLVINNIRPMTLYSFYCKTDTGTARVRFGDGTNWTADIQCTTSGAYSGASLSNNTFTMREDFKVQVGTQASNPNIITITADVRDDAD